MKPSFSARTGLRSVGCLRLLFAALVVVAVISLSLVMSESDSSDAASSGTTGSCSWTLSDDGLLTISPNGDGIMADYTESSTLPWNAHDVKAVEISAGVTHIGSYAFYRLIIETATIGPDVTSIGKMAFGECWYLKTVNYNAVECNDPSDSYGSIFYDAGSSVGTTVVVGDNVKQIPSYLFYTSDSSGSPNVTTVTIGTGVQKINNYAFGSCPNLSKIYFNAIKCDGYKRAFSNAGSSVSEGIELVFGDQVTVIPQETFSKYGNSSAPKITSVTMGSSVKTIDASAFNGCTSLKTLTIGSGVTAINRYAFYGCTGLETIYFNAASCGKLATDYPPFYGAGSSSGFKVIFGETVNSIPENLFRAADADHAPKLKSITLGSSVKIIGASAFAGCTTLIEVTWGESVETIGNNAFKGCTALPSLSWCSEIVSVGESAFSGCVLFSEIDLPDSLESIGKSAFSGCTSLSTLALGDSITSLGDSAFSGCTSLTKIEFGASAVSDLTSSSAVFSGAGTEKDGISVTFNDGVTRIPDYLFYVSDSSYTPKITSAVLDGNVVSVGAYAFANCTYLATVTFGTGLDSIGAYAFSGCTALGSAILPDSLRDIGENAFYGCTAMAAVTVGKHVTVVAPSSFSNCTNLKTVVNRSLLDITRSGTDHGHVAEYASEVFGNVKYKHMGDFDIEYNTLSFVCRVTDYSGAAYHIDLSEIKAKGYTVIEIGDSCFQNCDSVMSLYLPDTVFILGSGFVDGCSNLLSIKFPAEIYSADSDYMTVDLYDGVGNVIDRMDFANVEGRMFHNLGGYMTQADHEVVEDDAVPATCSTTGLTAGSHCKLCGHVVVAQTVIPMTDHTEETDAAVPATCSSTGLTAGSHCSVCGYVIVAQTVVPKTAHTEETDAAVPATCLNTGLTEGSHCSVCGYVIVAQKPIPKTAHTEETDAAVPATCTSTGLTAGSHCSICGTVIKAQTVVPMTAHIGSEAVKENEHESTCLQSGYYESNVYCSVCHSLVSSDRIVIPVKAHTVETDDAVPATCTSTGLTEGSHCSACGSVLVAQTVIPMVNHTSGDAVRENEHESTCLKTGYYESNVYCSECGTLISSDRIVIPVRDHTVVTDAAVPATCTSTGLTGGSHCSVCGSVIKAQTVVPMLEHVAALPVRENEHDSTCLQSGYYESNVYCSVCHSLVSSDRVVIPLKDHTVVIDVAVQATCTTTGLTEGSHCSVCDSVLVAQAVVPVVNHIASKPVSENIHDSTCQHTGYYDSAIYCSVCGNLMSSERIVIPLKEHSAVVDEAIEATCTTTGLTEGSHCSACGIVIVEQEVVPKAPHTAVTDPYVAPTCTTTGLTEGSHCSVCGATIVPQEIIPKVPSADVVKDGKSYYATVSDAVAYLSSTSIDELVAAAKADPEVTLTVTSASGTVYLDNKALCNIKSEDSKVDIKRLDPSGYEELVGSSPVYEVTFGGNHDNFDGGFVTVTIPYSGSTDGLKVYYLADGEICETIDCSFSEGYVTFKVSHLSTFAIFSESTSAGSNIELAAVAAALIVVMTVFAAVITVRNRPSD